MEEVKAKTSIKQFPHYKDQKELKEILYSGIKLNDEKYSAADICFVCDITSSMTTYISAIKDTLKDFVENIRQMINIQPRVAFVGFRDKKDPENLLFKDFTLETDKMVEFIGQITCGGGDDTCEDLISPLKKVLQLNWQSDLNYVYLLLEAPAHGKRYHTEMESDYYPEDDKNQELEKLFIHFRKSRVNVVILQCRDTIDTMIGIIRSVYDSPINNLQVVPLAGKEALAKDFANNLLLTVTVGMNEAMANSRYRNFRRISCKEAENDAAVEELSLGINSEFKGKMYTGSVKNLVFEKKRYEYKLSFVKSDEGKFVIPVNIIGVGVFGTCYSLKVNDKQNYVAKIPKRKALSIDDLKKDVELNLLAKFFAEKFNVFLVNSEVRALKSSGDSFKLKKLVLFQ